VLPLIQGESRTISVLLFNTDGSPFLYTGTLSELLVKVYASVSAASIQKKFSLSQVTPIYQRLGTTNQGIMGFQFALSAADTATIAANNAGLPMTAVFTDNAGDVFETDFITAFTVSVPVVQT
jgi:hypothetical protein